MIGPALPPGLKRSSTPSDEDSDDDYGPALPPGFQKPVAGPSRPPPSDSADASATPTKPTEDSESSDDDSDVGPLPAAPGTSRSQFQSDDGVQAFLERERRQKEKDASGKEEKLERAEWMLKPPKESDLMPSLDPTKLRSRGFNSSADAARKKAAAKDQSLWTETPAERAQRLADEQSGKKRRIENAEDLSTPEEREALRRKQKKDRAIAKELEEYNASRSESLLDNHAKKQKRSKEAGEDDDGKPPAIWDRESMLGSAGMMDAKKRQDVISSAKGPSGLSSRFGSGGYA